MRSQGYKSPSFSLVRPCSDLPSHQQANLYSSYDIRFTVRCTYTYQPANRALTTGRPEHPFALVRTLHTTQCRPAKSTSWCALLSMICAAPYLSCIYYLARRHRRRPPRHQGKTGGPSHRVARRLRSTSATPPNPLQMAPPSYILIYRFAKSLKCSSTASSTTHGAHRLSNHSGRCSTLLPVYQVPHGNPRAAHHLVHPSRAPAHH